MAHGGLVGKISLVCLLQFCMVAACNGSYDVSAMRWTMGSFLWQITVQSANSEVQSEGYISLLGH